LLVDVLSVAVRAIGFVALFQAAGAALFLVVFGEQLVRSAVIIARDMRIGAGVAVVALLIYQLLGAARLTGELSGMLDASMHAMAIGSNAGYASLIRLFAVLGLMALAARSSAANRNALLVCVIAVVLSFALTGHTASSALRWALAPLLMLHLLVVAFWFGSLLPLLRLCTVEAPVLAITTVNRFSRIAVWLVPGLALAGVVLALALLPDFAALTSPYGKLLLLKILGFGLLLGLAALNKMRLVPAMAVGNAAAWKSFRRSVVLEFGLICLVLTVTAVMTGLFSPEQLPDA
jgi:copper resistance protein D